MCGIAGIYHFDGRSADKKNLTAMTRALAHRGPDGEGIWSEGPVGLGSRRLAIRDLTPAGAQPMRDTSGRVTVVFNGEIYNVDSLRRRLEKEIGYTFQSRCDTEVLVAGWLAWKGRLFEIIEGMFAVALWDSRASKLVLARDAAGVKPLFMRRTPSYVSFASEIKSLVLDGTPQPEIDSGALHTFFAQGYVTPTRTLFKDIAQLAPGSVLMIGGEGETERRFWEPSRNADIRDLGQAIEAFSGVWRQVVPDLLVSDVPVGVLQSGGIDSSLISTCLRGQAEVPLFTAAFTEDSHDESANARSVAAVAGHPHHQFVVDSVSDAEETFLSTVVHFDGQVADSSAYALNCLCREVRRHVAVVLTGDGADEFFGGYPTYRATRVAERLRPIMPRALAALTGRMFKVLDSGSESRLPALDVLSRFFAGLSVPGPAHVQWRRLTPRHLLPSLYGPAMTPLLETNPLADYAEAVNGSVGDLVDRCLIADQRHYLPSDILLKVDAMSMAHGLEVRVPFLDRRIMEVAGRMHSDLLCPLVGLDKKVLRESLRLTGVPSDLTKMPKKGFNVPVARMLRTQLAPLGERLLIEEADRLTPYLSVDGVFALWRDHQSRRANHGYTLWALLSFACWLALSEGGAAASSLFTAGQRQ